MIDFREINMRVTVKDVAERLGLEVNRSGFICCPFHIERTASCRLYDHKFYCFGCGRSGDSIDLVVAVLGVSKVEAAQQLNEWFSLGMGFKKKSTKVRRKLSAQQITAEMLKCLADDMADLHRWLLQCCVPLRALADNLGEFCQQLLEDDDLRKDSPREYYEKYRTEFEKYYRAEQQYKNIRAAVERSRRNGQGYPFGEVAQIVGRSCPGPD